jgi:hypothetical protein
MGTPTIVPIDLVTIPLALPNILLTDEELNIADLNEVIVNIKPNFVSVANSCLEI